MISATGDDLQMGHGGLTGTGSAVVIIVRPLCAGRQAGTIGKNP